MVDKCSQGGTIMSIKRLSALCLAYLLAIPGGIVDFISHPFLDICGMADD